MSDMPTVNGTFLHECQNCSTILTTDELKEIEDLLQRVEAGEPMPSGECPHCGALAQPLKDVSDIEPKDEDGE